MCRNAIIYLGVLWICSTAKANETPQWWYTRGLVGTNLPADDFPAINVGQLKNMAYQTWMEVSHQISEVELQISQVENQTSNYVQKTGDTMSGNLHIQSNLVIGTVTATGLYAVAEGSNTEALGEYSHAEGYSTVARAEDSHAAGLKTIAKHAVNYIWSGEYDENGWDLEYFETVTNQQFSVHAGNGIRLYGGDIYYQGNLMDESDLRLKQNIRPLSHALDKVGEIRGVYFEMIKKPEVTEVGVIAQEVEAVLPEVVVNNPEGYKSLDYSKLTAFLIEAMKELKAEKDAEIERRKAQILELTQRIRVLEKK